MLCFGNICDIFVIAEVGIVSLLNRVPVSPSGFRIKSALGWALSGVCTVLGARWGVRFSNAEQRWR